MMCLDERRGGGSGMVRGEGGGEAQNNRWECVEGLVGKVW